MKLKFILPILPIIALSGCTDINDPEVQANNKSELASGGTYVGTLPDGRIITSYRIDRGNGDYHAHYIYTISDNSSVTVNHAVPAGKTTQNAVEVYINGKTYVEKN